MILQILNAFDDNTGILLLLNNLEQLRAKYYRKRDNGRRTLRNEILSCISFIVTILRRKYQSMV